MTVTAPLPETLRRQRRGQMSYQHGQSAEEQVARRYQRCGHTLLHRRWRGSVGEIDLIMKDQDLLIFVEVKASKTLDRAMNSLRPSQISRIRRSAEEYLQHVPTGSLTNMRFDLACCDASGQAHVIENAFGHF